MIRTFFAAALLAGFMTAPALAQTKVGDWTIEKREKDTHCNAARGYKDKDDENHEYVMVLSYAADKIVFVIIYDGWEWEKPGEILRADFSTDKTDIKTGRQVGSDGQDHGPRHVRVRSVDHGRAVEGQAAVARFRGR